MRIVIAYKRTPILVALSITLLLTFLSSFLFLSQPTYAADASIKKSGCVGEYTSTGYQSPFSSTSGMCLGEDATLGLRFYQFAVKLPAAIQNADITAKAGSFNIEFVKQSDTLYVSQPGANYAGMGYGAFTIESGTPCNVNDATNKVVITAKGNGKTQAIDVNLCSYKAADKTLIYQNADSLTGDNGTVSTKGWIEGKLGVVREGAPVGHRARTGTLEKDGVISIELSGKETRSGNNSSDWFTLTDGNFKIDSKSGLDAGVYNLTLHYNDCPQADVDGAMAEWTSCDIKIAFNNITVVAGRGTVITNLDGSIQYYNAAGEVVDLTATVVEDVSPSTCAVDGIGWIVCPVMNFMGSISDIAYDFISNSFLKVDVGLVNTTLPNNGGVNPTYSTWQTFRNIANVLFVIVFLIIVFSQLTSAGISNYGVKKMLPRLVIAAILVNASYFIAQIAVDISNILGYGLKSLFETLPIYSSATTNPAEVIGQGLTWAVILAGALGAVVAIVLAISVPVLLASLLSVLMIVLILIGRQALIVLLIILSPIAFVAWLLPNTEQYFKKWWKMFFTLLMVFPIVGVLFGASKLAATVLQAVGAGSSNELMQVIAMGVATIPLIMTPSLLKGALSATGSLGAKLSGISSKLNSQVGGKVKSESRLGEALKNRQINNIRNRASRRTKAGGIQSAIDNSSLGRKLGFRAGAARATQITDAADQEEMKNAQSLWEKDGTGSDFDKLEGIVDDKGIDTIEGRAALAMLAAKGGASQVQRIRNGDEAKGIRSQKGADFDRTIAPYFSALKAKDYRAVGLHEGKTNLIYSAKATDMHSMTDEALIAGEKQDATFATTLRTAASDPEQARFFSANILKLYGGGSTPAAPQAAPVSTVEGAVETSQAPGETFVDLRPGPRPTESDFERAEAEELERRRNNPS